MTKTSAAFRFTAGNLWQNGFRVYFWTFTFVDALPAWEASRRFTAFVNHLQKVLGGDWGGVRVVELHKEHGCHYHALINRRLSVDIVRRVSRCYGFGRIHVCVADEGAAGYLAKYLTKQVEGPKTLSGRNARRWASFGLIRRTRVSDVQNESPEWVFRREHKLPFISYVWEGYLRQCWDRGEDVFKAAWFAATRGELGSVMGLVHGKLLPDGMGGLVERFKPCLMPF